LRKSAYLGSFYEYGFDTPIGPVFVVSTDLSRPLAAGAQATLSLAAHGVSVVPGA
jgi:iron(III) transport system ATP-binding protein